MDKRRTLGLVLAMLGAGAVVVAFLAATQLNAQNQTVDDLVQHLRQRGVPITSIHHSAK